MRQAYCKNDRQISTRLEWGDGEWGDGGKLKSICDRDTSIANIFQFDMRRQGEDLKSIVVSPHSKK